MKTRKKTSERCFSASFALSSVIHLLAIYAIFWWNVLASGHRINEKTYYVDVVTLPVASPQAGHLSQKVSEPENPAISSRPVAQKVMTLPAPKKLNIVSNLQAIQKTIEKTVPNIEKIKPVDEAESFAERMKRLEGKVAASEEEAKLEQLRCKIIANGNGRVGVPVRIGTEGGSDYLAYIQSRIKDGFRSTISYTSKKPEVVVRIFIDSRGKLSQKKIERSSGDRTFEIAAIRAIDMASDKFIPPPDHKVFEGLFVFRPQGIINNKL